MDAQVSRHRLSDLVSPISNVFGKYGIQSGNLKDQAMPGMIKSHKDISRERTAILRAKVGPQVDACLLAMREKGVVVTVFGSYARGDAFGPGSDINLLIEDRAGLRDVELWTIAWDAITSIKTDLVFSNDATPERLLMIKAMLSLSATPGLQYWLVINPCLMTTALVIYLICRISL